MARRRKGRPVDGVLLLDKPVGLSSNQALQICRRIFGAQKAGHTGALDPLASGVLPVCFGEATKYSSYLLDADKGYFTRAVLGVQTTTGDSEGEPVRKIETDGFDDAELEVVLEKFRGDTLQVPSMYSALKHQGKPLYEYARKGITVERKARPITISELTLIENQGTQLELKVTCSKGTYIRSLVDDIGEALAVGAHVCQLRRNKAGPYRLEDCVTLDYLRELQLDAVGAHGQDQYHNLDGLLRSVDEILSDFPAISVNPEQSRSLLHGQACRIPHPEPADSLFRCYAEPDQQFIGLVESAPEGVLQPKRMLSEQFGNSES